MDGKWVRRAQCSRSVTHFILPCSGLWALGAGPSVLTIPRSTLMKIHSMANDGDRQYQQLELDLYRLAALYIVEYMKEELLSVATSIFLDTVGSALPD